MRRLAIIAVAASLVMALVAAAPASAARPGVVASSSHLNFGKVPVFTVNDAYVTFTNNTAFTVFTNSYDLTGSFEYQATLGACNAAVAPGGTCTLLVSYSPFDAGRDGGRFKFYWDDYSNQGTEVDTASVGVGGSAFFGS